MYYESKMADGLHLGKIEKLLYLGRDSSDFDEIWPWRRSLEICNNRHTSATFREDFDEIWHADAARPS